MFAIASLLAVVLISLLVTRVATSALIDTGMSRESVSSTGGSVAPAARPPTTAPSSRAAA